MGPLVLTVALNLHLRLNVRVWQELDADMVVEGQHRGQLQDGDASSHLSRGRSLPGDHEYSQVIPAMTDTRRRERQLAVLS